MNFRVHLAIGALAGVGASLMFPATKIETLPELAYCAGLSLVGAALPDIDISGQSKAKKAALGIICGTALVGVVLYKSDKAERLFDVLGVRMITGIALFFILTLIGLFSKHRSFTHQLIGLLFFSLAAYLVLGMKSAFFFTVGMLSHQLADMLNMQKIQYFFPLKKPAIAIGLCKSSSVGAEIIGVIAIVGTGLLIYIFYGNLFALPFVSTFSV